MKKVLISLLLVVTALFAMSATVGAAPGQAALPEANGFGPFDGTFHGRVRGDNGTSAPMSLRLTHRGQQVDGTVFLGSGLLIDAGLCGSGYVPSGAWFAAGETSAANPRILQAESQLNVGGIDVTVILDGEVSPSGRLISADAKIDLPWICGGDPVLTGTLYRAH